VNALTSTQRKLFKVADLLPKLNYNQDLANEIIDIICKQIGVQELSEQQKIQNELNRINTLKNQKKTMKRNLVVIQPFNTIEDKEGVFKQDFFQFKFLDMELQNRTSVPLNIKRQVKNRKLISGVQLPDLDQHNNKLLSKIERSESLKFI
jgi:hypothetical protein